MKKVLVGLGAMLFMATNANALTFSFDYLGINFGTMEVEQLDSDTLTVKYFAAEYVSTNPFSIPYGAQTTGFGFVAPITYVLTNITNPLDDTYTNDKNDLDWIKLESLASFPNPANTIDVTKSSFLLGATEGDSNNFNPPGILPGEWDEFYLNFGSTVLLEEITWTGVRLQSLPDNINDGSLFLADKPSAPVPEPTTMLLFGTGLAGLAAVARRRKN